MSDFLNPDAKTIQIFLPTGEPRGIRIAELTTRIVQAVAVPRSDLAIAKKRPELDHVGTCVLLGEPDQQAASKGFWLMADTSAGRSRRTDATFGETD